MSDGLAETTVFWEIGEPFDGPPRNTTTTAATAVSATPIATTSFFILKESKPWSGSDWDVAAGAAARQVAKDADDSDISSRCY